MITFQVQGMTCGHCTGAVTRAVQSSDPGAVVRIDLATHRVEIDPDRADAPQLLGAIRAAGYAAVEIAHGGPG